jgi:hypothetical protein
MYRLRCRLASGDSALLNLKLNEMLAFRVG